MSNHLCRARCGRTSQLGYCRNDAKAINVSPKLYVITLALGYNILR